MLLFSRCRNVSISREAKLGEEQDDFCRESKAGQEGKEIQFPVPVQEQPCAVGVALPGLLLNSVL